MFKGLKKLFKKHKEEKEEKKKKEKEEIIFSNKLISLIGPSSVGKTAFFQVFTNNEISSNITQSMGIDLRSSEDNSFELVDTCGNIGYFKIMQDFKDIIKRCHIFLYLYNDVPETYQLKTINQYIDIIKKGKEEFAEKNTKIMNKLEKKCFFFMLQIKRDNKKININIEQTIKELNKSYSSNNYFFKYAGSMLLNNNSKGEIVYLLKKVINPETFEISKDVENSDYYSYI